MFPPSLIEGSVSVWAVRGFPRKGEGRTLGVVRGHPPRDGRTLGAVRGPPAEAPRAQPVWMPLKMTEEYKHKRRTMGRAT
jgi:hypothetical protein